MKHSMFSAVWMFAFLCNPTSAQAQGLGDLIGGFIQASQVQAASQAWSELAGTRRYCAERALERKRIDIPALIRAGIMPSDSRLGAIWSDCRKFETSALKSNYRCTIVSGGETIATSCNQAYQVNGRIVDVHEAIDAFFAGSGYSFAEVETDIARTARVQRQEAQARRATLVAMRPAVEAYLKSDHEKVRIRAQAMLRRMDRLTVPGAEPDFSQAESLRLENDVLKQIEAAEKLRLAALIPVQKLRSSVDELVPASGEFALDNSLIEQRAALEKEVSELLTIQLVQEPVKLNSAIQNNGIIGPGFDCDKAKTGLGQLICSDNRLRRLDMEMLQPFYALRHLYPDERNGLRDEAVRHSEAVNAACRIPERGTVVSAKRKAAIGCVATQYETQKRIWAARVAKSGLTSAEQEIRRPIEAHLRAQSMLISAGLLVDDTRVDGIYGNASRNAIIAFQSAQGLSSDGFMSDATFNMLNSVRDTTSITKASVPTALDEGMQKRLSELETRYAQLLEKVQTTQSEQQQLARNKQTIGDVANLAREAVKLNTAPRIQETARVFLAEFDSLAAESDKALLAKLAIQAERIRPELDGAIMIARISTPNNRFLIEGNDDDVFILANKSPSAPSLVRNIRGEWDFHPSNTQISQPVACQATKGFTNATANRAINARYQSEHPRIRHALQFPLPLCDMRQTSSVDLVLVSRMELLRAKPADVAALLSAVETGILSLLVAIKAQDVQSVSESEAIKATEIETGIENGELKGYGWLVVEGASPTVCQATVTDQELHLAVLKTYDTRVADELKGRPVYVPISADAAFISARRGQCGAIYAPADDLRVLLAAFRRESVAVRYLPLWISLQTLETAKRDADERAAEALRTEADRARIKADEERIAAAKASDAATTRAKRQEELQKENQTLARGFEASLRGEMRVFLQGVSADAKLLNNEGVVAFTRKYPPVASWYTEMLSEQWQVTDEIETKLLDYGTADFRGRPLEAGFAMTRVKLRNRTLGEYRDFCIVTAYIDDKEFAMQREPFTTKCDDTQSLQNYKVAQRFSSKWLVD